MNLNNFFLRIFFFFKRKIKSFLFKIISYIFKLFDNFMDKENNLIVFAQKNNLFSDNSKAFFKHVNENENNFKSIWLVDNRSEKERIEKKYGFTNISTVNSFKGINLLLRAKTVVISNSLDDFFLHFSPSYKKEVIQLWHGIKWSKKFEYPNNNFTKELTIICSSSEEHKSLISTQNKIDSKKIFITGLPRNDLFFNKDKNKIIKELPLSVEKDLKKNIILYAPTHKEDLISDFFPFNDRNFFELNKFLKDNNTVIYLRPHINDTNKSKQKWLQFFNEINCSEIKSMTFMDLQDINLFLPITSVLITDYSTIYTDAMLLNIPMIFIPYDIDTYKKKRGLVYDYESVTAGDKVLNQKDLIISIKKILDFNYIHNNKLTNLKRKFHKFEDGNSSKRVMAILKSKINKQF